jgi:hypothetical protein
VVLFGVVIHHRASEILRRSYFDRQAGLLRGV